MGLFDETGIFQVKGRRFDISASEIPAQSSSGLNSGRGGILSQSQQPQPINLGFISKSQ